MSENGNELKLRAKTRELREEDIIGPKDEVIDFVYRPDLSSLPPGRRPDETFQPIIHYDDNRIILPLSITEEDDE